MAQTLFETVPSNGLPHTLLVVDDEVLIRLTIADHLRDCGFHVIEAANGEEAVRVLEAGEPVDLVFSDVQMPGSIDGFALARWVRQNRPGMPVLLTSGYVRSAEIAHDLCEEIVEKPYDPDDLAGRLRRLLPGA